MGGVSLGTTHSSNLLPYADESWSLRVSDSSTLVRSSKTLYIRVGGGWILAWLVVGAGCWVLGCGWSRKHSFSSLGTVPTQHSHPSLTSLTAEESTILVQIMTDETTTSGSPAYDRWNLRDESDIEYGHLHKTNGAGIGSAAKEEAGGEEGFYITTAINYTNGPAHMGHAYEAATADVIARFQRLKGTQPSYFVTGADEHGQKIANTAADQGKEPVDICNTVRSQPSEPHRVVRCIPDNPVLSHAHAHAHPNKISPIKVRDWVPSFESTNLGFE
jgi:tRNA synthetases class I (M)